MRIMKLMTILSTLALLACCFLPWVIAQPGDKLISGFRSDVTNYGKPGLFHLILCVPFLLLLLIDRPWSLKTAFFIGAFNVAWALRNFITVSACAFGVCPQKQPAIYGLLLTAILQVVLLLFVDTRGKTQKGT